MSFTIIIINNYQKQDLPH